MLSPTDLKMPDLLTMSNFLTKKLLNQCRKKLQQFLEQSSPSLIKRAKMAVTGCIMQPLSPKVVSSLVMWLRLFSLIIVILMTISTFFQQEKLLKNKLNFIVKIKTQEELKIAQFMIWLKYTNYKPLSALFR